MQTINLVSVHRNPWLRQFPYGIPQWDKWRFVFNAENESYDYLVVFDELHAPIKIFCNSNNIIHLSTEPPLVRHYCEKFLNQFAWTIRQNKRKDIEGAIYQQPGLNWHIGWKPSEERTSNALNFEQIKSLFDQPKNKLISVISSNIRSTPQHRARLKFAKQLKKHYGDKLDFYGRGFVTMDDKLEALKDYRFHVVLENCFSEHYFTEKLTDCILSGTYPIYYGCPNLDEYFPHNSYRRIDLNDLEGSINTINNAINESLDTKFRDALSQARELTLYEYNLFPTLIHLIQEIELGKNGSANSSQELPHSVLIPLAQHTQKSRPIRFILHWLTKNFTFFNILRKIYRLAEWGR